MTQKNSRAIQFKTPLIRIGTWTIIRLPKKESEKLPSRGMVMVEGTVNGYYFQAPLEPDGMRSHWLKVDRALREGANVKVGDVLKFEIKPVSDWPEPELPMDLKIALSGNKKAQEVWDKATSKAHWDWIRWIHATKNSSTRQKRIDVALSKLTSGERRPCCFNRNMCCEPAVSQSGVLLESIS